MEIASKHLKSSCDLYIELRRALRLSLTKPQNDHPGCMRFYFSFARSNGVLIEISGGKSPLAPRVQNDTQPEEKCQLERPAE